MRNVLAFDIETIPDTEGGKRLYGLEGLEPEDIARAMFAKQKSERDSDFLPLHLHRVLVISLVLRTGDSVSVWSLGDQDEPEKETIRRFFEGLEKYRPTLVSWNGGGFDLPVLNYRSLIQGVAAPTYWDTGQLDREFRFDNYINRFHYRHTDLMDALASFQPRANAPLDQMSVLCGFPGKLGMDGSKVWDAYCQGRFDEIRDYCETDSLNTYLLYLRWEFIRGNLSESKLEEECTLLRETLREQQKPHLELFLNAWSNEA